MKGKGFIDLEFQDIVCVNGFSPILEGTLKFDVPPNLVLKILFQSVFSFHVLFFVALPCQYTGSLT